MEVIKIQVKSNSNIISCFNEIENYLQMLAKSRAIQIQFEKKILVKIEKARQAMEMSAADTSM